MKAFLATMMIALAVTFAGCAGGEEEAAPADGDAAGEEEAAE